MDNKAYILIPVHNRRATTLSCLQDLDRNGDLTRHRVVVIDDGSTDGTGAAIQASFPTITVLTGDGHLWWTGAIRLGMEYAIAQGAQYLVWLNDDCRLAPNALDGFVQFCHNHPKTIVGAQGFEQNDRDRLSFGGKRKTWQGYRFLTLPPDKTAPCDLLSGNLVCMPRAVVDAIGYPDVAASPHYGGDSLYLLRAQNAGFRLFVDSHYPVFNQAAEARLCPADWLMAPGDPWQLLRLAFNPYSGLSWRVWWRLNWLAYGPWGVVMFLKKYLSVLPITLLRLLPVATRQRLFRPGQVSSNQPI
ncbi:MULTISPECIES: glycosyltransferase family 2 protein [Cyanophyceae]|uniref:Glycosyltransferase family 2 protein n=1 Tax=Leptolyngbya subtilissima DQ-A4 TaxID=2933933 RepID=A0ABV0K6K1_9CYAN|nr:glycosyltransferase family 2 protein [Nodosilinea sp. FACHB-141]MBD2113956.1 glycosyltransferase family 2 protein [Nodosilinea sp. FACHB-141]